MTRYVTDDLKIMTKKAIADVIAEDEDCFIRNLKYVLEHLKPVDIEIYAKFLFAKLVCVKENAKNDTQTDLRKIDDMQHDKAAYKALCEKWLKQQSEINRLREVIKRVDEQIHRIKDCPRNTTAFWQIESAKIGLNEALNGESEEK